MPPNPGSKQANREMRHQDAEDAEVSSASARDRGERPTTRTTTKRPTGMDAQGEVQAPERTRRDPSRRKTAKPDVNLRRTSETAPLRTAMDTISECFTYCLDQGQDHVERQHLTCMLDAWDLLNATSSLVARGSGHADRLREVCAEAVKACEESCEAFDGDQTMAACADVCREAFEHLTA